jgi:hypothetical protein
MPTSTLRKRAVPVGLGIAMLATVVAAALSPNIGSVAAQSTCQYNNCQSGSSTPFPWWIVGVIILIIVGLILAYLIFGRRRPPSKSSSPPSTWEPPAGASAGGAVAPAAPPASGGGAAPPYLETPEDVGASLPAVGAGAAAGGVAAGGAAAATEEEPDIDSLMAELDKISGEILKKSPKTGNTGSTDAGADDTTQK